MSRPSVARWPRLLLIADRRASGNDAAWLQLVEVLAPLDLPVPAAVQLRIKETDAGQRRRLLAAALELPRQLPLLVNGTLAEALELGADGVHWPEAAIPDPAAAQPGEHAPIRGASVHSPQAAERAVAAGATYVAFGPVFPPRSKPGAGRGLEELRHIAAGCSLPVLALGGVDAHRVASCLDAGAAGIAVVGALLEDDDPAAAARRLASAL